MKIKATVLCENCVYSNLGALAEHGWSIFLETDQGNFLFDTGQGLALLNNARVFKKDLASVRGGSCSATITSTIREGCAALCRSPRRSMCIPIRIYSRRAI